MHILSRRPFQCLPSDFLPHEGKLSQDMASLGVGPWFWVEHFNQPGAYGRCAKHISRRIVMTDIVAREVFLDAISELMKLCSVHIHEIDERQSPLPQEYPE